MYLIPDLIRKEARRPEILNCLFVLRERSRPKIVCTLKGILSAWQ
jgi:hypothetical protein